MTPEIQSKRFFLCPECKNHEFEIEHLFEMLSERNKVQFAGPWYCEYCGAGWSPSVYPDGRLEVESRDRRTFELVELIIPPLDKSIRLLVKGMRFSKDSDDEEHLEHQKYYYEEHTCPTNYFRGVEAVALGNESDPHGLAMYVGYVAKFDPDATTSFWMNDRGEWVRGDQS